MTDADISPSSLEIATELTSAWLANPNTRASIEDALAFFHAMRRAAEPDSSTPRADHVEALAHEPAVSVRRSLASRDHVVSMIDGKPYRTLRRHLSTHGLTPDGYRERYNLKPDYPMVAPSYSEQRRAMAKALGLGRKPGQKRPAKPK